MNTPWQRLVNDPRTWEAIDSMLPEHYDENGRPREVRTRRGCLREEDVFPLLQHLSEIPKAWEALANERPEDSQKRRAGLADKIRALSQQLDKDPQARHFRIINSQEISQTISTYSGIPCDTVADFLNDFADFFESHKSVAEQIYTEMRGKKTTRNSMKEYVQREVVRTIFEITGRPKQAPRTAMAKLVNAILDLKGTDQIKGEDLAHI